ncbi:MAG: DUF4832 domain-containing protein [Bryobacteraceae bacterium]|nr:DUF4832 domain-containing protein [Bryobacteraceae bacterium]
MKMRQALTLSMAAALGVAVALPQNRTVVTPADTGGGLTNPGMGWVFHHYDNSIRNYGVDLEPWDTVDEFPGVGAIYLRLAWSHLEPEEGKFVWSVIDTPAQRWIAKGKQVAFRFTTAESGRDQAYATPEWVRRAGAKGRMVDPSKGIAENGYIWEPDFDDPVYLAKLDRFLEAAARRYDGCTEVAFVDVGTFGVWGEGHTYSGSLLPYTAATIRTHIDLHRKHFKRSLLAANDDFSLQGRGLETMDYARQLGLALRDDSIIVQPGDKAWHHAYLADWFWPNAPVILESAHYGYMKERGYWGDGSLYLKAVEAHHASLLSVHGYPKVFLADNRALIDRINRRLGYRLQLLEASWPAEVKAGGSMAVGYRWRNAGVAPCYPGGHPAITLKDSKGGIAGVFVDEDFDVRVLPVGPPEQAHPVGREVKGYSLASQASRPLIEFRLPPDHILKPGTYDVYVSVGARNGAPKLALPLAGEDGHRRYLLGKIAVR